MHVVLKIFCKGDPMDTLKAGVHALVISELDGNVRSSSPPAALPPGEESPLPIDWRLGWSYSRSGRLREEKSLAADCNGTAIPQSFSPWPGHFTD